MVLASSCGENAQIGSSGSFVATSIALAFAARAQFVHSNNAEKEIERTKTRSKANLCNQLISVNNCLSIEEESSDSGRWRMAERDLLRRAAISLKAECN